MSLMKLNVPIYVCIWMYVYIHLIEEEGTRIARAVCEDGAICITLGGRDPYGTGGVRRRCHVYQIGRKGPVLHGRSAKTVLWYVYIPILTN